MMVTSSVKLTLKGLSLFFKILPFSNTDVSILATVHFLNPKLGSFSDMVYYFHQLAYWDSKVPNHFVGLYQMQFSRSFDWNWCKQYHPKRNASGTHQSAWAGSLKPQTAWQRRGAASFEPPLTCEHPL